MAKKKEEKKAKQDEDLFDEPKNDETDMDIEFEEDGDTGEKGYGEDS